MNFRSAMILVAALAAAFLTGRLGVWQLDRAEQKTTLQAAIESQAMRPPLLSTELADDPAAALAQHHRAIVIEGFWLPEHTVYLENRQMNGRPGFFVVTPLRLADGSAVLVQRGWLPRDMADRTRVARPPTPAGTVRIEGRIAPPPSRLYDFAGAASGPIRQNIDIDALAREIRVRLRPLSIIQLEGTPPLNDGLSREWLRPAADVAKHHGYAFQWFALSALILGLYAWFQIIRPRRQQRA
jgi:surfeit locus 1 family protein